MSEPRKLNTGSASGGFDQSQYEAARRRAQEQANQNARRRIIQQPMRTQQQARQIRQQAPVQEPVQEAPQPVQQASVQETPRELTHAQRQAMAYRAAAERKYGNTVQFPTREIQTRRPSQPAQPSQQRTIHRDGAAQTGRPRAQVQQLDAGRWFHRQFTGSYIPTLEEVLALCKGKAELNIEIKPSTFTPTLEAETVQLIHAYDYGADCVVTSQSYETLCKVKELDPDITTGYILALGVGTYYDLPAADFFSVESTFITAGMVQQIHLRGKTISAWTINRQQDAEKLLQLGVDDLITDKPEIIAPLLARDKALDNRLLWLRDQIQELLAAPDAEEAMEVEETIEDAIEDPEEVLDEA